MRYFDLYRQGFCESVWNELQELSQKDCSDDLREEMETVALEFAERAFWNFSVIEQELRRLGYAFRNPDHVLVRAIKDAVPRLDDFEKRHGALTIASRAWYSVFHQIDFQQDPEILEQERRGEVADAPLPGLGFNCKLVFDPLEVCESEIIPLEFRNSDRPTSFLPTGACGTNNDPIGVEIPSKEFDGVFTTDGPCRNLGGYVRWACIGCGFPLWTLTAKYAPQDLGFVKFPDLREFYRAIIPQLRAL